MLRNDEIIALNAIMFAERWGLQPWIDVRWDEEHQLYNTFILSSAYDSVEDEAECQITSMEDLNILLATDAEFYRKVTTLISIGTLEAYDIQIESLVRVIVDRIEGMESDLPYPYSMMASGFIPDEDYVRKFRGAEVETGELALEAIKVLSRTGDWWGETLEIRYIDKEWSNESRTFVASEDKYFTVHVSAQGVYQRASHESVELTDGNFHLLISSVSDVILNSGIELAARYGVTQNFWASCLFCERSDEVNDELTSSALQDMPVKIASLFPSYESQLS